MQDDLKRLVALSPPDDVHINALVRSTCGRALSLPPPPSEVEAGEAASEAEKVAVDFAEQFSVDVASISEEQRTQFVSALGGKAFRCVVLMYIADFVPRVLAGLGALRLGDGIDAPLVWDHDSDPADVVFNGFLPAVGRLAALDPVTSEIVRLRGAAQHRCRLCNSLREAAALDEGGSEDLYGDIERYEASARLSERQKAALRYVDALIWSPSNIVADVAEGVRATFSDAEALELTLDVMRNASNKIAVSFAADAPRVEHGTEVYRLMPDGQTQYS